LEQPTEEENLINMKKCPKWVRGNLKRIVGKYVFPQNRHRNIPLPPYVSGIKGTLGQSSDKTAK